MLLPETEELFKKFETSGDPEVATCLLDLLNDGRRQSWIETVQELDLTHSSRKAWNLLRHLGSLAPTQYQPTKVTANEVAVRLLGNSSEKSEKKCHKPLDNLIAAVPFPPSTPGQMLTKDSL